MYAIAMFQDEQIRDALVVIGSLFLVLILVVFLRITGNPMFGA